MMTAISRDLNHQGVGSCILDDIPVLGAEENPVSADGLRPDAIFAVGKLAPVEESPQNFGFNAWCYFIHSF